MPCTLFIYKYTMIKDIYAAHFYIIINSFDIQIFFMVQTVFI